MDPARLAYQAIKYRQRDGWTHRDVLRLCHARAAQGFGRAEDQHQALFHWMTHGWPDIGAEPHPDPVLRSVWAFERMQRVTSAREVVDLIIDYNLPREAVPTQWLNDESVWGALLNRMPLEAMVRNLAKMTSIGLLFPMSDTALLVKERLLSRELIRKARLHPVKVLAALLTYQSGHGARGSLTWTPVREIVDALDAAFYLAFQEVEPTAKRLVLALDVSGSMDGSDIAGVPGLTARVGSAAMVLVTAATEQRYHILGFSHELVPLTISPRQRLDDVCKTVDEIPMGGTDCAAPMLWAAHNGIAADAFVVYTDSETWAGQIHPTRALELYRQKTGIPAKLIVVGMVSNEFTIADPSDAGMLDVVGFDTAVPAVVGDFIADRAAAPSEVFVE